MLLLKRTNNQNPDLIVFVKELDAYLKITDGDEHEFYNQFNGLDNISHCVVAYVDGKPAGCVAIKEFDENAMEIKRMYLRPEYRGKSIAEQIITELESWALELGYQKTVLETGERQVEAVRFYHKMGYELTPNYGQYIGMGNSSCFEKQLA
jgi:GNAT superfamily N-acetyltransferase